MLGYYRSEAFFKAISKPWSPTAPPKAGKPGAETWLIFRVLLKFTLDLMR